MKPLDREPVTCTGPVIHNAGRRLCAGALLALLGLLLAGCNLFRPATPEEGETGSALIASYADPESCLKYMALGIESKDNVGLTAYTGALAVTESDGVGFRAYFDQAVWALCDATRRDTAWTLDDEEGQFYPSFIALRSDAYDMEWQSVVEHETDTYLGPSGDTLLAYRHYTVKAISGTDTVLIAIGYADLYFFHVSSSRWALMRWMDRVDSDIGAQPSNEMWRTFGYWRLNASTGG